MTIEITDLEDFKDKFSALIDAHTALAASGTPLTDGIQSRIIDEFLPQFYVCTPAPAPRISAGWVITVLPSKVIPFDFQGKLFRSQYDAHQAVLSFNEKRGYGMDSDYDIKEVSYFG